MAEPEKKTPETQIALLQLNIANILEKVDDINKKLDTNFVSRDKFDADMKLHKGQVKGQIELMKKDIEMPVRIMYATVLAVLGLITNKILELIL